MNSNKHFLNSTVEVLKIIENKLPKTSQNNVHAKL